MDNCADLEGMDLGSIPSKALLSQQADQIPAPLRAGDKCPVCQVEHLDYDGLLNLSCPQCGPASVGCFT